MISKKKQSKSLNFQYSPDVEITENLKEQIIRRFKTTSQGTLVGFALYRFSLNAACKTDADFQTLLSEMDTQIKDEPLIMKQILGNNFQYFKTLFSRTYRSRKITN